MSVRNKKYMTIDIVNGLWGLTLFMPENFEDYL